MVCFEAPVRSARFVSPSTDPVLEPAEDVYHGGLFGPDDPFADMPRLVSAPNWCYGEGWFYPLLVSELPDDGRLRMGRAFHAFHRAGVFPCLEAVVNIVLWCQHLAGRYVFPFLLVVY